MSAESTLTIVPLRHLPSDATVFRPLGIATRRQSGGIRTPRPQHRRVGVRPSRRIAVPA
jgi:hypothetical protein